MVTIIVAVIAAILVVTYVGAAVYATSQVTGEHPEWRAVRALPADFGLASERAAFTTRDGVPIVAWWLPAAAPRGSVVLAHGNSDNRSGMLPRAAFLVRAGFNVLAIDLRAHGESGGTYMSPGYAEAEDVIAAVGNLAGRGATRPFVLMGYSYGAVAVIEAGARSPDVAAVIADSGFPSVEAMLDHSMNALATSYPLLAGALRLRALPGLRELTALAFRLRTGVTLVDGLNVWPALSQLAERPLLVISGALDPLAVPEDARAILAASRSPASRIVVLEGATHQTHSRAVGEYETAVADFLRAVLERESAG